MASSRSTSTRSAWISSIRITRRRFSYLCSTTPRQRGPHLTPFLPFSRPTVYTSTLQSNSTRSFCCSTKTRMESRWLKMSLVCSRLTRRWVRMTKVNSSKSVSWAPNWARSSWRPTWSNWIYHLGFRSSLRSHTCLIFDLMGCCINSKPKLLSSHKLSSI